MRGYSGSLVFFLFSFLLLPVSLEADSQIQSNSDAAETTVTPELTTTVKSNDCRDLQSSYPIAEVITCTGAMIRLNSPPYILDLSQYRDHEAEQLMTDTDATPPATRIIKNSIVIKESQLINLKLYLNLDDKNLEFTVIHNINLKNITLTGLTVDPVKVTVKGNKELSEETINQMNSVFRKRTADSYIQGYGECSPRPSRLTLESFSYLIGCKYFKDDLIIDGNTDITNPKIPFSDVQGCLMITDTKLTDISFVDAITSTNCDQGKENLITGNKDLCLSSKRKFDLKKLLNAKIEYNQKCKDKCTPEWAKENNRTLKCDIIEGDLVIVGVSNVKDLDYLSNVEEIHGRLEVHHNFFRKYTILPRLKKVAHSKNDSSAIFIHDNYNLTFINLSSLKNLSVPGALGDILIVQDNNNNAFIFPDEEVKRLEGLGRIRVPRKKIETITQAPTGDSNSTRTTKAPGVGGGGGSGSKEEQEKQIEAEKKKEESDLGLGLGLGLGLPILAFIVIGAIIGLVVFLLIRNKKRKAKAKSEMKSAPTKKKKKKDLKDHVACVEEIPLYPEVKQRKVVDDDGKVADVDDFKLLETEELHYVKEKQKAIHRSTMHLENYVDAWMNSLPLPEIETKEETPKKIFVNQLEYEMNSLKLEENEVDNLHLKDTCGDSSVTCSNYEDVEAFMNLHKTYLAPIKYMPAVVEKVVNDFLKKCHHPKQLLQLMQSKDESWKILGEVNGSIWDLLRVFKPTSANNTYIFCGNYMNGSRTDLQTLLYLLACAAQYGIILLRGINEYGDRAEELVKKTLKAYFPESTEEIRNSLKNRILQAFEKLPFAALVNGKALVVHGGISESWYSGVSNLIEAFDRLEMPLPAEIKPLQSKLISDLLYSEPSTVALPVTECGAGCYFDQIRLKKFLSKMGLDLLVRGRSTTGFDISMNNRLISLSCCYDADFAKYGPDYAFVFPDLYSELRRKESNTWPFGVLVLKPSGSIKMELYCHKFEEKMETQKNPQLETIEKDYQAEIKAAEKELREKLHGYMWNGYTDKDGVTHKGYDKMDEENGITQWRNDFIDGFIANMCWKEAFEHYKAIYADPSEDEKVLYEMYGYYKYMRHGKCTKDNFKKRKEDDRLPIDLQGNGSGKYIWMRKKSAWEEVSEDAEKKQNSFEYALNGFKRKARYAILHLNHNDYVKRPPGEEDDLEDDTYMRDNYCNKDIRALKPGKGWVKKEIANERLIFLSKMRDEEKAEIEKKKIGKK